ncbi:hypothetical protein METBISCDRAFT_25173 [Metschnikowia bicuspidata]|uniref:Calcineurin-like phosphoesterase domain-containing protein n=1 Tax=Metschnikowia bicuspidata TaxID=27322 RepID=A0A4P9ZIH0_9ASCO|nr:hypothetical protein METBISCDRAFT_25173 [Metschnikowia bicuspidata]
MASLARVRGLITVLAVLLNFVVYFYPDLFNASGQCQWHNTSLHWKYPLLENVAPASNQWVQRLFLIFPALQAASALSNAGLVPDLHMLAFGDPQINGNWPSTKYIKRLDNFGNDYYLGHIYSTMKRRLWPSHVAVMGDQFLSQWILDSEFYNRTYRFVERIFPRDAEYKRTVVETWAKHEDYDWWQWLRNEQGLSAEERFRTRVYDDMYDWYFPERKVANHENPLFINLTGNHDVGYSGDTTWQHMARFHHLFGQNNYVINYNRGKPEEWRLVVLDSLTLEGPALQEEFRQYTWRFLEKLREKNNAFKGLTLLLTHIPFYKKEGLCADGPEHIYYYNNTKEPYKNGLLRSQNHLRNDTTQAVLDIIFPNNDKEGIILTGHDHVGCDSWYSYVDGHWVAGKEKQRSSRRHIREIVVRAMMGDYGGQTGLVTGHFDETTRNWQFAFLYCSFTVQHLWWASKMFLLLSLLVHSASFLLEPPTLRRRTYS